MSAVLKPGVEMLPMQAGDLDEVVAVENTVYPFPWSRGNFADSIKAGYSAWVCRIGGELVGYAVVMMAVDEAHLLNISIAPRRQGEGYGARLLRHAMDVGRRSGALSLLLEVRPSNEKAIALYRHFGFREVGRRRGYYPAVGGREDAIVMVRELSEVRA